MTEHHASDSDSDGDVDDACAERVAHTRRERSNSRSAPPPVLPRGEVFSGKLFMNVNATGVPLVHYSPQTNAHSIAGSEPVNGTVISTDTSPEEVVRMTQHLKENPSLRGVPSDRIVMLPESTEPVEFLVRASPEVVRTTQCIYLRLEYKVKEYYAKVRMTVTEYRGGSTPDTTRQLFDSTQWCGRTENVLSENVQGMPLQLSMFLMGLPYALSRSGERQEKLRALVQQIAKKHMSSIDTKAYLRGKKSVTTEHYYLLCVNNHIID